MSRRYYCIAVDTIGGPGKSVPNEQFSKGQFQQTAWVTEVIDYFKLSQVYMAGVSNGAHIAFHYTTTYPERVRKAICLEGGIITHPVKAMVRT